jgi:hypothetical protein
VCRLISVIYDVQPKIIVIESLRGVEGMVHTHSKTPCFVFICAHTGSDENNKYVKCREQTDWRRERSSTAATKKLMV